MSTPVGPPEHPRSAVRGLAGSWHVGPSLAVTTITAALTPLAHLRLGPAVVVTVAVLVSQASVGWGNDWLDPARDRATGRRDKAVVRGDVTAGTLRLASALAGGLSLALWLTLGWRPLVAGATVLVAGWAYNLGLKATAASFVPYAVAFGTLPAVVTTVRDNHPLPSVYAALAGALIGVSAHLGNVLPDLIADTQTGVRGIGQRLGARISAMLGPILMFAAILTIVLGLSTKTLGWNVTVLSIAAVISVVVAVTGLRHPGSRVLFTGILALAVGVVVVFAASGARLI